MKTFLIMLALGFGVCVFLITSYAKLGQWVLQDVVSQEGTPDAMKDAVAKDEAAFTLRYTPFLDRRVLLTKIAAVLDDDFFLAVTKDSLDRYQDTPLQTSEGYGYMLLNRALLVEEKYQPPTEAFQLFKRYQALFPNAKEIQTANNAVTHLMIKYGMQ